MTSGVPVEASIDLYNKLIALPYSEKQEIGQIEFRLRALKSKNPSDLRTTVAFLQALIMSGKTGEAVETADYLWSRRNWLDTDVQITFLGQLTDLGACSRAKELLLNLQERRILPDSPELLGFIVQISIGLGDIELLRTVVERPIHPDQSRQIKSFLHELKRLGLDSHFERHQAIIQDVVNGFQCGYSAIFFDTEAPELSIYIFVDEPREKRRHLENRIDDALLRYYSEQGLDPAAFVPLITTQILDTTVRHAPKAA